MRLWGPVARDDAAPVVSTHVTSASFSGRDRFEALRETCGRTVMRLDMDPHPVRRASLKVDS